MKKLNVKSCIITGIVCLLPLLAGILLADRMPTMIAVHFNEKNVADHMLPKWLAIYIIPVLFTAADIAIHFFVKQGEEEKGFDALWKKLLYWAMPFLSVMIGTVLIGNGIGMKLNLSKVLLGYIGLLFIFTGLVLPKAKKDGKLGVRTKKTLESDAVWKKANSIAGKIFIGGGVLMILFSIFGLTKFWICAGLIVLTIGLSYLAPVFIPKEKKRREKSEKENIEDAKAWLYDEDKEDKEKSNS